MSDWTTQLAGELRANRRKATALAVLSLLLLLLWARVALKSPAPADATPGSAANQAAISALVPASDCDPERLPIPAGSSSADSCAFLTEDAVSIEFLTRKMSRNLFATDWDAFAPTAESLAASMAADRPKTTEPPKPEGPSVLSQILSAAMNRMQESKQAAQSAETTIADQAAKLKLSGILLGPNPHAYIDGRWVPNGETINGFRITSIQPGSVLLRKSGHDVRLTMP
jgi:hypothetical protein